MEQSRHVALVTQAEDVRQSRTLFPAYSTLPVIGSELSGASNPAAAPQWLVNSSFDVSATSLELQVEVLRESSVIERFDKVLSADQQECARNEVQEQKRRASSGSSASVESVREHGKRIHRDDSESSRDAGDDQTGRRRRGDEKKRKKDKKRKKKHDRHRRHHADDRRSASRSPAARAASPDDAAASLRSRDSAAGGTRKVFLEDMPGLEAVHAYRVDKAPDPNNVAFGSLYKLHVARLRRTVAVPLGLRIDQWLQLEPAASLSRDGKRKRRQRHNGASAGRYFAKDAILACCASSETVNCSRAPVVVDDETAADFLTVRQLGAREPGTGGGYGVPGASSTADVYDLATSLYAQGLAPARPLSSAADAEHGSEMPEHVRRTGDYNRRLRERPSDVDLWLEFVAFQDDAAAAGALDVGADGEADSVEAVLAAAARSRDQRSLRGSGGGQRSRALLEKKLAILDKALAANPSSVHLKAARLLAGDQLWDGERASAEWQSALHVHVNDASLWQEYLRHCRSGPLSRFDHGRVEAAYEKCLRALRSVLYGDIRSHPCLPGTAESMLDIFVHYCYYLHQCGYTEKSVAFFQAMIEFNCFAPAGADKVAREDALKDFRGFWRRRSARFGETGAKGWRMQMERAETAPPMRLLAHEETAEEEQTLSPHAAAAGPDTTGSDAGRPSGSSAQLSAAWLSLECMRERIHWLPWRPCPEEGLDEPDDPLRDVTAEAVLPVLFHLPTSELQLELCHAFLDFLGVAAAGDDGDRSAAFVGRRGTCPTAVAAAVKATAVHESTESLGLELLPSAGPGGRRGLVSRPGDGCHLRERFVANCLAQLESLPTVGSSAPALRALLLRDVRHWTRCARLRAERQAAAGGGEASTAELARSTAAAALAAEGKKLKQLVKDKLQGGACCNDSVVMCAYADAERAVGNEAAAWRTYGAVLLLAATEQQQVAVGQQLIGRCPLTSAALALASLARAECAAAAGSIGGPATADAAVVVADRLLFTLGCFALGMPLPTTAAAAAAGRLTAPQLLKAKAVLRAAVEDEADRLHSAAAGSAGDDDATVKKAAPLRYSALAFCCAALDSLASADPRAASEAASAGLRLLLPGGVQRCGGGRSGSDGAEGDAERVAAAMRLMLDCVSLLQLHRRQGAPGAVRCLRQTLELGIAAFPHSVSLLHAYVDLERKVHVVGRARRLLSSVARLESSAECRTLLRCFSVYFELLRCQDVKAASGPQMAGTASEYVRALCAEADVSPAAAISQRRAAAAAEPSVLFWRLCVLHEVLFGSEEAAKAVFYRALQHLPWAKALYMDAIGYFPEQLEELLRLMEEKGIRVHVPSVQELQMLLEMAALHGAEEPADIYDV